MRTGSKKRYEKTASTASTMSIWPYLANVLRSRPAWVNSLACKYGGHGWATECGRVMSGIHPRRTTASMVSRKNSTKTARNIVMVAIAPCCVRAKSLIVTRYMADSRCAARLKSRTRFMSNETGTPLSSRIWRRPLGSRVEKVSRTAIKSCSFSWKFASSPVQRSRPVSLSSKSWSTIASRPNELSTMLGDCLRRERRRLMGTRSLPFSCAW
ncbi:hypothetical protein DFH06DRAFT_1195645 [Mycena polygramma]|nr:hypothetical protein DFH06DRAFT_1195645 [Mycena polygramma]